MSSIAPAGPTRRSDTTQTTSWSIHRLNGKPDDGGVADSDELLQTADYEPGTMRRPFGAMGAMTAASVTGIARPATVSVVLCGVDVVLAVAE